MLSHARSHVFFVWSHLFLLSSFPYFMCRLVDYIIINRNTTFYNILKNRSLSKYKQYIGCLIKESVHLSSRNRLTHLKQWPWSKSANTKLRKYQLDILTWQYVLDASTIVQLSSVSTRTRKCACKSKAQ